MRGFAANFPDISADSWISMNGHPACVANVARLGSEKVVG